MLFLDKLKFQKRIIAIITSLFFVSFAREALALEPERIRFWSYTFHLIPFFGQVVILLTAWTLGVGVLSILHKKNAIRSFSFLLAGAGYIFGLFLDPMIGVGLFTILAGWFVVDYAVIILRRRKNPPGRFDSHLFKLESVVAVFLILSIVTTVIIDRTPSYQVKKLKTNPVVAQTKLLKMGRKAVPALIDGLENPDPVISASCARILRHVPGKIPQKPLFKLLDRKDKKGYNHPRLEVAITLGEKGDQQAVEPLLQAGFKNVLHVFSPGKDKLNFDPKFYQACIQGVKKIEKRTGKDEAAQKIYRLSMEETDPVRSSAWGLIGVQLGTVPSLESMSAVFDSLYKDAQLMILDSMEGYDNPAALKLLFRALSNPSIKVRRKAIEVLKKRNEMIAVYKLISALNDPSPDVRSDANWALINITGENFDFNADDPPKKRAEAVKRWKAWWAREVRE